MAPFDSDGVFTPEDGAENAFPGKVIASATWNAIFTDIADALTQIGEQLRLEPTVKTTAGPFTITTETFIILNKGSPSATSIVLPAVASRDVASLTIVNWGANAGDITFTPHGAETINGLSSWIVGSGGSLILRPSTTLSGWVVYI